MKATAKKIVGISAMGVFSLVEMTSLQPASAAPAIYTGGAVIENDTICQGNCGGVENVNVQITVDAVSGFYKITAVSQIGTLNGGSTNYLKNSLFFGSAGAVQTLINETLAAQSGSVTGITNATALSQAWNTSLSHAVALANAVHPIGSAVVTPPPPPPPVPTPTPTPTHTTTPPPPRPTPTPTPSHTTPPPRPVSVEAGVLAKLVKAGTITQAQADIILAALQAAHATHSTTGGSDDYVVGSSYGALFAAPAKHN